MRYRYEAIRVPEAEFAEALDWLTRLGYQGLNVTVPLKQHAFRWASLAEGDSEQFGVLNTLSLADGRGINTDAPGFLDTLRWLGVAPRGKALVLGAGGTAQSLVRVLHNAGFEVSLWNRTRSRATALVGALGLPINIVDAARAAGQDLIVNATSAGLAGEAPLVDWSSTHTDTVAIDAVYAAEPTLFMRHAAEAGAQTADGRLLLAAQAARSFAWWHGTEPPYEVMRSVVGV
jgi:shikimate dehydrogenase